MSNESGLSEVDVYNRVMVRSINFDLAFNNADILVKYFETLENKKYKSLMDESV